MRFLEIIRDRLVQRSLIGKRKLDRTATRRELDGVLRDLGEGYRELVRAGRIEVPAELGPAMQRLRELEDRLAGQQRDIEDLEKQQPSTT